MIPKSSSPTAQFAPSKNKSGGGTLLTLNDNYRLSLTKPSVLVDDGIKPVFRVTTRLGRSIETTLSHPYLTIAGWRPLAALSVGDRIAVPRHVPIQGAVPMRESEMEEVASDVLASSVSVPLGKAVGYSEVTQSISTSIDCIPEAIFRLPNDQLARFTKSILRAASFTTESEKICRQLQHLLLRLGQMSKVSSNGATWTIKPIEGTAPSSHGHVYWDEIVSIEAVGMKQVYDLTIPETHNFVANDICVHNTAFCLNIAQHCAVEAKAPCAIFSLEMSKEQLVQRLLCAEARIDANKMRTGFLQSSDWQALAAAMGRLGEAPLYIDDSAAVTALDVRAKARRLKAENKGIGMIIIDYIQLMQGRARSDGNRVQEISEISRGLKQLARELDCPVIALSQLSRAVEARQNKRPMLSDLRESGAIEQDADIVMFIYRDDYYNQESEKRGEAEIIVAKQRNGPVGTVELLYQSSITRFLNKAINNQYVAAQG
jgi:replicative DNA helicase